MCLQFPVDFSSLGKVIFNCLIGDPSITIPILIGLNINMLITKMAQTNLIDEISISKSLILNTASK
jgi:hypothetical protein